jgi:FlaG/FlaF family flagellin (archaellin)
MNRTLFRSAIATAFLTVACTSIGSQTPQAPKTLAIIRNVSTSQVTFEYYSGDTWQKVTLDSLKDTNIDGDRVRIGTDRQDKATITVELPIERGKKYLVFWNDPPGMWDFKGTV